MEEDSPVVSNMGDQEKVLAKPLREIQSLNGLYLNLNLIHDRELRSCLIYVANLT